MGTGALYGGLGLPARRCELRGTRKVLGALLSDLHLLGAAELFWIFFFFFLQCSRHIGSRFGFYGYARLVKDKRHSAAKSPTIRPFSWAGSRRGRNVLL